MNFNSMIVLFMFFECLVSQHIKLSVGQVYDNFMHTPNWNDTTKEVYASFVFNLDTKLPGQDLVIIAKGRGGQPSDPNIYISTTVKEPKSELEADYSCSSFGNDICVILAKDVKQLTPYYITVACEHHCDYQISIIYEKEISMSENDFRKFEFLEDKVEIVRITVPQNLSAEMMTLAITVTVINILDLELPFQVFLNQGDQIPHSKDNHVAAEDVWTGDKIIIIQRDSPASTDIKLKSGLYTMSVSASKGCRIQIVTKTYGEVRDISLFETVEDQVMLNGVRYYKLNLSDSEEYNTMYKESNLFFQLTPYSGKPDLYVNYIKRPNVLDNYQFSNLQGDQEAIMVSQSSYDTAPSVYYIAIHGGMVSSTYSFNVYAESVGNTLIQLNEMVRGNLYENETQNYKFIIQGNSPRNVTVELKEMIGSTALIIRMCGSTKYMPSCVIGDDDIKNRKELEKINHQAGTTFISSDSPGSKTLIFEYDPNKCSLAKSTTSQKQCLYNVAVYYYSAPKYEVIVKYELLVKVQDQQIILRENTPQKDIIQMHQSNYYRFTVPSSEETLFVAFVLSPIQGHTQLYVSNKTMLPSKDNFQKQSQFDMVRYSSKEEGHLNGTYYIAAYGETSGLYMITAIIVRDFEEFRHSGAFSFQYIQLNEGQSQSGFIENGKALFKIDLSSYTLTDITKQNISIVIDPIIGSFRMYASDRPETQMNETGIWRYNMPNHLKISSTDKRYPEVIFIENSQVLYIHVYPENKNSTGDFKITYTVDSSIKTLYVGSQIREQIEKGQKTHIKLQLMQNQQVQLIKTVMSNYPSDVMIYYSKDEKNSFPSEEYNDGQIMSDIYTTIDAKDVLGCSTNMNSKCQIYLTAHARDSSVYIIKANNITQIHRLSEGYALQVQPVPISETYLTETYFYFTIQSTKEISVIVTSHDAVVSLYIDVTHFDDAINPINHKYPSQYGLSRSAVIFKLSGPIIISEEELLRKKCADQKCILFMTLKPQIVTKTNQAFSIIVSTDLIQMLPSKPYLHKLSNESIQYYSFTILDSNATVILQMTPLSDISPEVIVSFGVTERPNLGQYDWITQHNHQIIIYPGSHSKVKLSTKGTYMYKYQLYESVGVYALRDCSYSIQYSIAGFAYAKLTRGIPTSGSLKKGKIEFYDFYNIHDSHNTKKDNEELKILLSIDSGKALMYGTTYISEDKLQKKVLEPISSYQFNNKGQGNNEILIIPQTDPNYCTNCHYLVAVMAISDVSYSIVVADRESFTLLQNNKVLRDYVAKGKNNQYRFYGHEDFMLGVILFTGEINIKISPSTVIASDIFSISESMSVAKNQTVFQKSLSFQKAISETENVFSFMVEGHKNANYSIQCVSRATTQQLKIGQAERVILNPKESKNFTFRLSQDAPTLVISMVKYQDIGSSHKSFPQLDLKHDTNFNLNKSSHNYIPSQVQQVGKTLDSKDQRLTFYESFAGQYLITLTNQHEEKTNVFLTVSINDMDILTQKSQVMDVLTVGGMKTWMIFVSQPVTLLINVVACRGLVNVYFNTDVNALKNGQYLEEIKVHNSKQAQGTLKVTEAKEICIGTKAIYGDSINNVRQAIYKINYQELPLSAVVPIDWFNANDNWDLDWSIGEDGQFIVSFQKLQCKDNCISSLFADQEYTYTIYFQGTTDEHLQKVDKCELSEYDSNLKYKQMHTQVFSSAQHRELNDISFSVDLGVDEFLMPDHYLHFNVEVQVKISEGDYSYPLSYFYNQNKFIQTANNQGGGQSTFMLVVLILILVVAGLALLVLYKRNVSLKLKLNYEQSDVRNIVRGPQSTQSDQEVEMKHHKLMEDSKL